MMKSSPSSVIDGDGKIAINDAVKVININIIYKTDLL